MHTKPIIKTLLKTVNKMFRGHLQNWQISHPMLVKILASTITRTYKIVSVVLELKSPQSYDNHNDIFYSNLIKKLDDLNHKGYKKSHYIIFVHVCN